MSHMDRYRGINTFNGSETLLLLVLLRTRSYKFYGSKN